MAELIPPYFGEGPASERTVFRALERRLSAEWTVWWRVNLSAALGPQEGEIDFLCAHPRHGLAVLEVKGGSLSVRDGQWFQDGRRLRKAPALQATAGRHLLVAYLLQALRVAALPFPVVHGLCFPNAAPPAQEPPDATGITLYAADLDAPEPAILRLLARDPHPAAGLVPVARLKALLAPTLAYRPTWRQRREGAERELFRLTGEQARILDAFARIPRLRVRGCAGSGKTELALRRAKRLAGEGKRVLLLCFNLLLAESLRRRAADCPALRIEAVYDFLADLLGRPQQNDSAFYRALAEDAPPHVQALVAREPYDAVIVDEAQDFSPAVWRAVRLLAEPKACAFLVFYDPGQNIFQRDLSALPDLPEAVLTANCRNARAVFDALSPYAPETMELRPDAPPGDPSEHYAAATREGLRARLAALLNRLTGREGVPLEDIVLIGAHRREEMGLEELEAAYPGLRYYTYRKYKGLEAPVLVLLDVDRADPLWNDAALYTAISRAVCRLVLLELAPRPS